MTDSNNDLSGLEAPAHSIHHLLSFALRSRGKAKSIAGLIFCFLTKSSMAVKAAGLPVAESNQFNCFQKILLAMRMEELLHDD